MYTVGMVHEALSRFETKNGWWSKHAPELPGFLPILEALGLSHRDSLGDVTLSVRGKVLHEALGDPDGFGMRCLFLIGEHLFGDEGDTVAKASSKPNNEDSLVDSINSILVDEVSNTIGARLDGIEASLGRLVTLHEDAHTSQLSARTSLGNLVEDVRATLGVRIDALVDQCNATERVVNDMRKDVRTIRATQARILNRLEDMTKVEEPAPVGPPVITADMSPGEVIALRHKLLMMDPTTHEIRSMGVETMQVQPEQESVRVGIFPIEGGTYTIGFGTGRVSVSYEDGHTPTFYQVARNLGREIRNNPMVLASVEAKIEGRNLVLTPRFPGLAIKLGDGLVRLPQSDLATEMMQAVEANPVPKAESLYGTVPILSAGLDLVGRGVTPTTQQREMMERYGLITPTSDDTFYLTQLGYGIKTEGRIHGEDHIRHVLTELVRKHYASEWVNSKP